MNYKILHKATEEHINELTANGDWHVHSFTLDSRDGEVVVLLEQDNSKINLGKILVTDEAKLDEQSTNSAWDGSDKPSLKTPPADSRIQEYERKHQSRSRKE